MVAIDGYEFTKQGRAGAALGMSMFSAFIAGMFGLLGLGLVAPTLAEFALDFGPPEYFALTLLGLTLVSYLATNSMWKAVAVTVLGLLLGTVGLDPVRSLARFTFGSLTLQSGIDLVPMVMGLFGISEVFNMLERRSAPRRPPPRKPVHCREVCWLSCRPARDWRGRRRSIGQGTLVGFLSDCCPAAARRFPHMSRTPSPSVGETAAEYSARARSAAWPHRKPAANAATCSGFIPLLTLGLPDNVVMALILGAFMLHGVTPGPTLMVQHPEMFWAIVTSMFIGNCMLIFLCCRLLGFSRR